MFDLHTHSLLSDGCLLPSELARRYEEKGFKAIAITDHVDISNIKRVVSEITNFCKNWPENRIKVLPGIELTHIPLEHFSKLTKYARKHGIKIIVAHGETTVEPVIKGTNKAALNSDINILAHPGKITIEEARLAEKKGVFLEITLRRGHRLTNKHVAKIAQKTGAKLAFNSDSHKPEDIPNLRTLQRIARQAGLSIEDVKTSQKHLEKLLKPF